MYKEKVVNTIDFLQRSIQESSTTSQKLEQDILNYQTKIKSLSQSIDSVDDEYVKTVLEEQIEDCNKEITKLNVRISHNKDNGFKCKEQLKFIQGYICPHENKEVIGFDYHNNLEDYKCSLCGAYL